MAEAQDRYKKSHFRKYTEPKGEIAANLKKGTIIFKEDDVLYNNMRDLDERKMSQKYGQDFVERQNLRNVAEKDTFVATLFENQLKSAKKTKMSASMTHSRIGSFSKNKK